MNPFYTDRTLPSVSPKECSVCEEDRVSLSLYWDPYKVLSKQGETGVD